MGKSRLHFPVVDQPVIVKPGVRAFTARVSSKRWRGPPCRWRGRACRIGLEPVRPPGSGAKPPDVVNGVACTDLTAGWCAPERRLYVHQDLTAPPKQAAQQCAGDHLGTTRHAYDQTTCRWAPVVHSSLNTSELRRCLLPRSRGQGVVGSNPAVPTQRKAR
jgi:hypothetical protein